MALARNIQIALSKEQKVISGCIRSIIVGLSAGQCPVIIAIVDTLSKHMDVSHWVHFVIKKVIGLQNSWTLSLSMTRVVLTKTKMSHRFLCFRLSLCLSKSM